MITAAYEHSKLGTFMFNLCAKWTIFLVKHRWLYYLLAFTWGIVMTLFGLIVTMVMAIGKIFSKNITFGKYLWIYYVKVGPTYWGGFETGIMFVRDQKSSDSHINPHEWGHTFQSSLLGIFMPFVVSIPSAIRWWARELFPNKQWKAYDAVWFEDAATQCGKYAEYYLTPAQK